MHTPLLTGAAVVRTRAPESEKKMSFDTFNAALTESKVQVLVTLTTKHDWAGMDPQV